MSLIAIISPPLSMVHPCLENLLGDPILLWLLRALPAKTERVFVITGDNHEKIAGLVADWKSTGEIKGHVECRQTLNTVHSLLELSKTDEIEPGVQVLVLWSTQPLISPAKLQSMASDDIFVGTLKLDHDLYSDQTYPHSPVLLSWSTLQFAAMDMIQPTRGETVNETANPVLFELLSRIFDHTHQIIECDAEDLYEVRTRADLAVIQGIARRRIVNHWLDMGVAFMDPDSAIIGPRVELNRGVTIEPQARLEGKVRVGEGTTIGQGSVIQNSSLGASIEIRPYCVINGSIVGDGAKIGPFAHLREGSQLDANVHVGNFVETKAARLRSGAKANHLSYLGDCEIGERTNIGAGCITCNYDGFSKHRTTIGKDAFIGSDCQLVAPVTVGDGAILGAGTTLTSDAPSGAIVLTRPETKTINGGAARLKAKLKLAKDKSNSQLEQFNFEKS